MGPTAWREKRDVREKLFLFNKKIISRGDLPSAVGSSVSVSESHVVGPTISDDNEDIDNSRAGNFRDRIYPIRKRHLHASLLLLLNPPFTITPSP
ncbi:hypothetical protein Peur_065685 [Populus x canadensis]